MTQSHNTMTHEVDTQKLHTKSTNDVTRRRIQIRQHKQLPLIAFTGANNHPTSEGRNRSNQTPAPIVRRGQSTVAAHLRCPLRAAVLRPKPRCPGPGEVRWTVADMSPRLAFVRVSTKCYVIAGNLEPADA